MARAAANALSALLSTPTLERRAVDYERMFDDFAAQAGGGRVADRFDLPSHVKNPDYYLAFAEWELLLELKQISTYRPGDTVDAYFGNLLRQGKVRKPTPISATQLRIEPESLSPGDWANFYRKFRPSVTKHIEKAARQLKETDALLPRQPHRPRFCGLLLINSGDYNLPLDLMFRLVEWRTKREWQAGFFSKLDFVSCLTVDLIRADQNPMQGRHIARPDPHALLTDSVRHVYECWLQYYAEAIGAKLEFHPEVSMPDPPLVLSGRFAGKIRGVDR
jgi:hypothetical protein